MYLLALDCQYNSYQETTPIDFCTNSLQISSCYKNTKKAIQIDINTLLFTKDNIIKSNTLSSIYKTFNKYFSCEYIVILYSKDHINDEKLEKIKSLGISFDAIIMMNKNQYRDNWLSNIKKEIIYDAGLQSCLDLQSQTPEIYNIISMLSINENSDFDLDGVIIKVNNIKEISNSINNATTSVFISSYLLQIEQIRKSIESCTKRNVKVFLYSYNNQDNTSINDWAKHRSNVVLKTHPEESIHSRYHGVCIDLHHTIGKPIHINKISSTSKAFIYLNESKIYESNDTVHMFNIAQHMHNVFYNK